MGVTLALGIVNTVVIQGINADLAVGVHDLLTLQHDTYVGYTPLFIGKISQIARLSLCSKVHLFAHRHLLTRITRQLVAAKAVYLLCKARAVNSEHRLATPQIRCFQKAKG